MLPLRSTHPVLNFEVSQHSIVDWHHFVEDLCAFVGHHEVVEDQRPATRLLQNQLADTIGQNGRDASTRVHT